jgi:hypothetical protein
MIHGAREEPTSAHIHALEKIRMGETETAAAKQNLSMGASGKQERPRPREKSYRTAAKMEPCHTWPRDKLRFTEGTNGKPSDKGDQKDRFFNCNSKHDYNWSMEVIVLPHLIIGIKIESWYTTPNLEIVYKR